MGVLCYWKNQGGKGIKKGENGNKERKRDRKDRNGRKQNDDCHNTSKFVRRQKRDFAVAEAVRNVDRVSMGQWKSTDALGPWGGIERAGRVGVKAKTKSTEHNGENRERGRRRG